MVPLLNDATDVLARRQAYSVVFLMGHIGPVRGVDDGCAQSMSQSLDSNLAHELGTNLGIVDLAYPFRVEVTIFRDPLRHSHSVERPD
jgi:hypothetical protein